MPSWAINRTKLSNYIKLNKMKETSKNNETAQLGIGAVSGSRFQSAYAQYWDMVKDIIDEEGWVYTKEAPHMLDAYFESNTGKPIEFQKSFGKSGDNPHWLTRGSRWRPSELS